MAESRLEKKSHRLQNTALAVTRWIGSPASIVIHSIVFIVAFSSVLLNIIQFDTLLLVLNTIISLEAIYLALFNQLAINYANEGIQAVSKDIDEMQEDVEEIQENVEEIQEDVDELQEDVEEMSEEDKEEEARMSAKEAAEGKTLEQIHEGLKKLVQDVEKLQSKG